MGTSLRSLLALVLATGSFLGCQYVPYCLSCDGGLVIDASRDDVQPIPGDGDTPDGPCVPTEGGEVCNGLDDDCNGLVDEGFDLSRDPRNCGRCGVICDAANAEVECNEGVCVTLRCMPGFADLDPSASGCEYRCPVFPTQGEVCNGLDDDCDGLIDEPEDLDSPPEDLCRTTPGTPCAGTRAVCATRGGRTTWFCDYGPGVEFDPSVPNGIALEESRCDGQDGDCDGVVDDTFPDLGQRCDNGALGACRDEGEIRCHRTDPSRTFCDLSVAPDPVPGAPMAEVCNGLDDNCDGIVDNADPADPARVREDLVHISRGALNFWIYRYEASRPDASAVNDGRSGARSCSRAGVLPWTSVRYGEAEAACAAAGLRLCTGAEWQAACEGAMARSYPYGNPYEPLTCNGGDRDAVPGGEVDHAIALTGAMAMCRSTDGVADLSGNVKEWTHDRRGLSEGATGLPIYVVRGGSYESPARGLTCQTDLSRAVSDTALPTLGFRCCADHGP
jgi:hypothetical protein